MVKKYAFIIFAMITLPLFILVCILYVNQRKSVNDLIGLVTEQSLVTYLQNVSTNLESERKGLLLFANSRYAATALYFNERTGLKSILHEHLKTQKSMQAIYILRPDGSIFSSDELGAKLPSRQIQFAKLISKGELTKLGAQQVAVKIIRPDTEGSLEAPLNKISLLYFVKVRGDTNNELGYIVGQLNGIQFESDLSSLVSSFKAKGVAIEPRLKFIDMANPLPVAKFDTKDLCKNMAFREFENSLEIEVCVHTDANKLIASIYSNGGYLIYLVFTAVLISGLSGILIARYISHPILNLSEKIKLYQDGILPNPEDVRPKQAEFALLFDAFYDLVNSSENAKARELETAKKEVLYQLSSQVAHDIRSPVTVLRTVTNLVMNKFSDHERILITSAISRIVSISEALLNNRKKSTSLHEAHLPTGCFAAVELYQLFEEKQMEFSQQNNLTFLLSLDRSAYTGFTTLSSADLKRTMSNIVNNAIDALPGGGTIQGNLYSEKDQIKLTIKDNGIGMCKETLQKLGTVGYSAGKDNHLNSGTGLGFSFAKHCIESIALGRVDVNSKVGEGTEVNITLPKAGKSPTLITSIDLTGIFSIYVLDDDSTVHQMWDKYLGSHWDSNQFELFCFKDVEIFAAKFPVLDQTAYAFIDFRLNTNVDGIDVITKMKLQSKSTLMTHDYLEPGLLNSCMRLSIKVMPKPFLYMNPYMLEVKT